MGKRNGRGSAFPLAPRPARRARVAEQAYGVDISHEFPKLIRQLLAFWVSILITLILKITTIYFITNDLLECIAKLSKNHKTQVRKDQGK